MELTYDHKATCFFVLQQAAAKIEQGLPGIQSAQLHVGSVGVTLIMFRQLSDGAMAHAEHRLLWEEIALAKTDILSELITDMHKKLRDAIDDDGNPVVQQRR